MSKAAHHKRPRCRCGHPSSRHGKLGCRLCVNCDRYQPPRVETPPAPAPQLEFSAVRK